MIRFSWMGWVFVGLIAAPWASAQEDEQRLYGDGVHAFFDDQFEEALVAFNEIINRGTRDPRVYYFRGLAKMRLGDPIEGEADFAAGATLEATTTGRFYSINRSLQRVQGENRIQLEAARSAAAKTAAARPSPAADKLVRIPLIISARPGDANAAQANLPDVSGKIDPTTPFETTEPLVMEKRDVKPLATPLVGDPAAAAAASAQPGNAAEPTRNPFESAAPPTKPPTDPKKKTKNPFDG